MYMQNPRQLVSKIRVTFCSLWIKYEKISSQLRINYKVCPLQVDGEEEEELDANAQEMLMQEYPSDCCPVR